MFFNKVINYNTEYM